MWNTCQNYTLEKRQENSWKINENQTGKDLLVVKVK